MGKKNNSQNSSTSSPKVTANLPNTANVTAAQKPTAASHIPVATRNNVAKAHGMLSSPGTPINLTAGAFPSPAGSAAASSSSTANKNGSSSPPRRAGGNRPGEFIMPPCNNNRKQQQQLKLSSPSSSSSSSSASSSSFFVTVCAQLFKVVVVPMGITTAVAYAYHIVQKDSDLNTKASVALTHLLTTITEGGAAAAAASAKTAAVGPILPKIDEAQIQRLLLAMLGLFMFKFTIKLFTILAGGGDGKNNNKSYGSLEELKRKNKMNTAGGGFDSDDNAAASAAANGKSSSSSPAAIPVAFAMPKIKKMKDAEIVALRSTEYSRLDRDNQCYLDYTGGMLYPESLIRRHAELLLNGTYGNPHSSNPTSFASTELCDKARADVLKFFNADPEEYLCIFTSNASGALRIVGESFPFVDQSQYLLLMDNHNSVNGIREFAITRGAKVTYARTNTSLRIDDDVLEKLLEKTVGDDTAPKLFAYPAQSNFSGVKHSLEWVERAQQLGWYTLLDAAAFVPTSPLDLSAVHPDFVSMSFYKVFGYPTGIGALLMRKRCVGIMQRPWFAGGTIKFVTCKADNANGSDAADSGKENDGAKKNSKKDDIIFAAQSSSLDADNNTAANKDAYTSFPRDPMHVLAHDHEAFEDGTINYLSLSAISYGLEFMTKLNMTKVSGHVQALTSDLIDALSGLVHSNGMPMINILGPNSSYKRGGTVSINVVDVNGVIIPPMVVEKLANEQMISIRSGCFCNPGDSEILFPEAWRAMMEILDEGDPLKAREMGLGIAAAIRISVGIPTSDQDIVRVITFLLSFKNAVKSQYDHLMVCPNAAH